ncbi:MAG: lactate utilization protein [Phycisphaerales bacterium]|jgi:L-lactate dehydrogenase complex protein LldG|nr:lactate utilization protein [Phycisphaerales bacterium]
MNDRELILSRVRAALGRSNASSSGEQPPRAEESLARLVRADVDICSRFIEAANRTGMKAIRASQGFLKSALEAVLRAETPNRVLIDVAAPALRAPADDACRTLGVPTSTDPSSRAFDADLSIIDATAGVAESGSVLLASDGRRRCAWIVPPKVVILVTSNTLVPDLLDLWSSPRSPASAFAKAPPAAMLLVSGPSKTADIEGVLVTGVHGPGTVHVVLVDDVE